MAKNQGKKWGGLQNLPVLVLFLPFYLSACVSSDAEAPTGHWRSDTCQAVAEKKLKELDLDRLAIKNIEYVEKRSRVGGKLRVSGSEAWVTFEKCQGNYIMEMNKNCNVGRTYATNECKKVIDL